MDGSPAGITEQYDRAKGEQLNLIINSSILSFNKDTGSYIRGGFLIRRSSAIRRFIAGFLKCDSCTIMKSFLKKSLANSQEISGDFYANFMSIRERFF